MKRFLINWLIGILICVAISVPLVAIALACALITDLLPWFPIAFLAGAFVYVSIYIAIILKDFKEDRNNQ